MGHFVSPEIYARLGESFLEFGINNEDIDPDLKIAIREARQLYYSSTYTRTFSPKSAIWRAKQKPNRKKLIKE